MATNTSELDRMHRRALIQSHKDVNLRAASEGIAIEVIAGAQFGLGAVMLHELGYSREQIIEILDGALRAIKD